MSILIKGMEMPKSCKECKFWTIASCTATFQGEKSCPLIEVPEPHGDLIDRGALYVIGYCDIPQGCEDAFDSGVMWLAERIDELPTIIPASEETE